MATAPSVIYPSQRSYLGIARELTAGTPLTPTNTIPVDRNAYQPEDTPKYLPDEAIRGAMAVLFNEVTGVVNSTFSFGAPNFLDVDGFWLDNAFGDLSSTSQGTLGTQTPTFATATAIGATNVGLSSSIGATVPTGSVIQINDGAASEVVVTTAGSSSQTIFFTGDPLRFAHTTSATAQLQSGAAAGYTHVFSLLNTGTGQPPTHTLTDYTGITPSVGARAYPCACVAQIDISGNAEQLLEFKVSGEAFLSAAAGTTPALSTSFVIPVPNWQSTVTIAGTPTYNIGEWSITLSRQLQIYWTAQNAQTPYIIARGGLGAKGAFTFSVAINENPLTSILTQNYQTVVIAISNGLAGANLLSMTFQASKVQFIKARPERNAVLIGFSNEWEAVANTTDVGGSGGLSPCKVTLQNNLATY